MKAESKASTDSATPWSPVDADNQLKARKANARGLAIISLILSVLAIPTVGTHLSFQPSDLVQSYCIAATSLLIAYCSLRWKPTALGIVALLGSLWIFYPALKRTLRMWDF